MFKINFGKSKERCQKFVDIIGMYNVTGLKNITLVSKKGDLRNLELLATKLEDV